MKKQIIVIGFLLAVSAILGADGGNLLAQTAVIHPVDPITGIPIDDSSVTVSIKQGTEDITGSWEPEPGQTVQIEVKVNGVVETGVGLNLIFEPTLADDPTNPTTGPHLTTSAYPGRCGNVDNLPGSPGDGRDFELNPSGTSPDTLKSWDCGGMAVLEVTTPDFPVRTFVLPQDDDFDGVPNFYEALNCPSGNCNRDADADTGPDALSPAGDGWTVIDEWRGWIVSNIHVRGNPNVKDLFLHEEDDPQCTTTAGSFPVGDIMREDIDLNFFASTPEERNDLLKNVNTLRSDVNMHQMIDGEFVDNFDRYDRLQRVIFTDSNDQTIITDRWINQYAIVPLGSEDTRDTSSNAKYIKLVRIVQCLDVSSSDPLGQADKEPPNDLFDYGLPDKDNGTAVLFVHRIVTFMLDLIEAGEGRKIKYLTCVDGSWDDAAIYISPSSSPPNLADETVRQIIRDALGWYYAHEGTEHAFDVTSTPEGTRKVSYGYHHAEGGCTNVDVAWIHKVDKKAAGYNKFYIPKYYGTSDKREIRVTSTQDLP